MRAKAALGLWIGRLDVASTRLDIERFIAQSEPLAIWSQDRSRSEAGERTSALPISSAPVFCFLMLEGLLIGRHLFYGRP